MSSTLVILGAGHAAYSLAREYRRHDAERAITLITRDAGHSYYKPNLSKAIAMGKSADDLILKTRDAQETALNISVLAERNISSIDSENHSITLADGETISYGDLVFATGADSRRFALAGDAADDVLHVNDLDEYRSFREHLADKQQVLIMGAGLVGSEFANDLHAQGIASTLVDPAPYPLATLLPAEQGATLQASLNDIGVSQHYGCHVTELNHSDNGYQVTLSNGETAQADLVLSAAGLSVDTTLAESAGVTTGRGIVVNDQMATNVPNIYAIGDCAEINGQLMPYIAPILPSVRALAKTLLGEANQVAFPAMPVTVKTPCCPVISCPPAAGADGEWIISGEAPDLLARFEHNNQLKGFACTGATAAEAKALQAEIMA